MKTNFTTEKCWVCGGSLGIHQFETMKCPRGGFEAWPGKQEWMETTFIDTGLHILHSCAPLLFNALSELIEIRQQMMISGETKELRLKEADAYSRAITAVDKAVPKVTYEIPAYPSDY